MIIGSLARAGETTFTLEAPTIVGFPAAHFPTQVAAADLDGNGTVDLVVPGRDVDGLVYVFLGNGDATFAAPTFFDVGGQTDWCELRDVNADGKIDALFAVRSVPGRLAVAFGNGDGTFAEPPLTLPAGREPRGLAADDFDGDGDIDAVVLDYSGGALQLFLNDGAGGFAPAQRERLNEYLGGLSLPQQLSSGDLDGDGRADLVATVIGGGRIDLLHNLGGAGANGVLFDEERAQRPNQVENQAPGIPNSVLADIDGDGDLDVVTAYILIGVPQRFAVMLNSDGSFPTTLDFVSTDNAVAWTPAVADLDGDGDLDVIMGTALPGQLVLHANLGSGSGGSGSGGSGSGGSGSGGSDNGGSADGGLAFGAPQVIAPATFFRFVLPVDLDGDGAIDLVAADAPSSQLFVFRNLTPQGAGGVAGGAAEDIVGNATGAKGEWGPGAKTPRPQVSDRDGDGAIDGTDLAIQLGGLR
ncbi:MAG: VCBS repeat-containing protein [Phycisphaerales bacterium]|nr:VCBS repeat-containing protein [Phycisphaerales bacterium]